MALTNGHRLHPSRIGFRQSRCARSVLRSGRGSPKISSVRGRGHHRRSPSPEGIVHIWMRANP